MTRSKISIRRGFRILGAATGAAFALVIAAGCNDPAPAPERQQEQQDSDDQQGDDQQGGDQEGGDQQGGDQVDD